MSNCHFPPLLSGFLRLWQREHLSSLAGHCVGWVSDWTLWTDRPVLASQGNVTCGISSRVTNEVNFVLVMGFLHLFLNNCSQSYLICANPAIKTRLAFFAEGALQWSCTSWHAQGPGIDAWHHGEGTGTKSILHTVLSCVALTWCLWWFAVPAVRLPGRNNGFVLKLGPLCDWIIYK